MHSTLNQGCNGQQYLEMRKKLTFNLNVLYLLFFAGAVMAQPPVKIEHYSTEQGLSHDIISSMFKDSQGYMWLGTFNGINKFDGTHITSFNSDAGTINNQRIDQIVEDGYNHLWVKSYDGQIYRFDKGTEKFTPLTTLLKLKKKVYIDRILSAADGMLWLRTLGNGVILMPDVRRDQSAHFTFSTLNREKQHLPSDTITFFFQAEKSNFYLGTPKGLVRIIKSANGQFVARRLAIGQYSDDHFSTVTRIGKKMYFGTTQGDLIRYDEPTAAFQAIAVSKGKVNASRAAKNGHSLYLTTSMGELLIFNLATSTFSSEKYNSGSLFSIFEDKGGDLWLEPAKKGVVRFDLKQKTFTTFFQRNDASTIAPRNHFRVFEDRNGTVWAVLRDGGFGYYDPAARKLRYFYNEPGSMQRRFSNLVTTALYDSSGVMLLHTDQRGLDKVIFNPNNFKLQLLVDPGVFKSENEIRGLVCDRRNRLWVSARSGLLYVFQDGKKVDIRFENMPAGGLGAVYTMFQSSDRKLWLGTKEKGLFLAQPINSSETQYKLVNFQHDANDPFSLSSNQVYSVTQDKAGRMWVGTFDGGLNLITTAQGAYRFRRFSEKNSGYPTGFKKIRHMAVDNNGRLWVGTTEGLVIGEHTRGNSFTFSSFSRNGVNGKGLGGNDIQYIFKDHKGQMWLGTSGGGLNSAVIGIKKDDISFKLYSTTSGLGNDYILSCIEDQHHRLWIATKSTLSRFDPSTGRFDNFNSYDGVPNDGFSEASATAMQDGGMAFGTIKGLLLFDPAKIKYHAIKANLVFTNLQVNNEDVNVGGAQGILEQNIDNAKHITLKHNQNIISIDYGILDFRSADRQTFQYRLIGFDDAWQNNKNRRRASYTNLPPGAYVFQVKSSDTDNYSNVPQKSLAITILPPFWKTWWAYLIYVLLFAILVEIIRRVASTFLQLRQKIAIEQQMTALKMNFFTNVSHELRTPLTLILNPIEEILKKQGLPEQVRSHASIVRKNANRMVHFVNQLLDLRKSQSGQSELRLSSVELTSFIQGIADYFVEEAKANQIQFEVYSQEQIRVKLDVDKIETVIYNLLSNAFKFSSAGQRISVELSVDSEQIAIVVSDNGYGVPEADLANIFQLYHESRNAETQHLKGTGIGLALAKELVELHGGTISAANVAPHGLAVTVNLPLQIDPLTAFQEINEQPQVAQELAVLPMEQTANSDRPRVLLVEDNQDMRSFLAAILAPYYRLSLAVDGSEGLSLAQQLQPDVVLSDIMMPKMDGIAMLDQLKKDVSTSHIPVILLSAKSALESQIMGLQYGADHYLSKPFNNELLLAAIAGVLQQRKRVMDAMLSGRKIVDLSPGQVVVTSRDEVFLQKVIAIVEEKMADPDFDIDTVAKMVNMARTTFFMKFKSLTQQAPVEFVRDMRLKMAKQYLDGGSGNISEISYSVGFSNAKYFSTCFKAAYGMSPSAYIKSLEA